MPEPVHADGTVAGSHGRSGDGVSCDVNALVGYLTSPAHSDAANAWAGVHHIAPSAIAGYFAKLTRSV